MGEFEVGGQLHAHAALPPGKEPMIPGWVGTRAGLDGMENWKVLTPL
jgi:hypothetical protein